MLINKKIISGMLCLVITACANSQGTTNLSQVDSTIAPLPTITNPVPIVTSSVSSVTQDIFLQTSLDVNFSQFGNLYLTGSDCAHSGIFGVQLTNVANMPSWWGILFSELFDVSKFQSLNFWVKGNSGGEGFNIWIDSASTDLEIASSSLNANVSSLEWRLVVVPLNLLTNGIDPHNVAQVQAFAIGVEPTDEIETICIDDIYFSP